MSVSGRKNFPLRIDPKLWAELEAWAQQEMRSVNGQIELLLREAVKKRAGGHDDVSAEIEAAREARRKRWRAKAWAIVTRGERKRTRK